MATVSVPRLVGATWYPVPCPEGASLTLGFPSEEACGAFCGALVPILEAFDDQLAALEDKHEDALGAAEEAAENAGRDSGYEDGIHDGHEQAGEVCRAGECEGYDIGWADGYAQAKDVLTLSAESA